MDVDPYSAIIVELIPTTGKNDYIVGKKRRDHNSSPELQLAAGCGTKSADNKQVEISGADVGVWSRGVTNGGFRLRE